MRSLPKIVKQLKASLGQNDPFNIAIKQEDTMLQNTKNKVTKLRNNFKNLVLLRKKSD